MIHAEYLKLFKKYLDRFIGEKSVFFLGKTHVLVLVVLWGKSFNQCEGLCKIRVIIIYILFFKAQLF